MPDYMLTTVGTPDGSARDIQVNNAGDIHEAIAIAEAYTRLRIDHGRGGIGSKFDPAVVIDAESGQTDVRHARTPRDSYQLVKGRKVTT